MSSFIFDNDEMCLRTWAVEQSIKINRFGNVTRIIEDARRLENFVLKKPDAEVIPFPLASDKGKP